MRYQCVLIFLSFFFQGDSGGPFVVNNIVVGIASWHIPWDSAAPDGYTDVYEYLDFIHMIMNQNN